MKTFVDVGFVILFALLMLLPGIAGSVMIEVHVPKYLEGRISSFSYNCSINILRFQVEFYNTGSIPYKARIRTDIFNNTHMLFTGWSKEEILMPGDRKNFNVYWYTNSTGNFTAKVRSYFANEILEREYMIEKNTSSAAENIFEITDFRIYDDYVIFDITAKKEARNVVVIPDFPPGWMFEQKKIDYLDDTKKTVVLGYQPGVWTSENLKLEVASDGGRYYTEKVFELKKETGILWFIHYIVDNLKIIFSEYR